MFTFFPGRLFLWCTTQTEMASSASVTLKGSWRTMQDKNPGTVYIQFVLSKHTFILCFHQNPWLCLVNLLNLRVGKPQLHRYIHESYIHESFDQSWAFVQRRLPRETAHLERGKRPLRIQNWSTHSTTRQCHRLTICFLIFDLTIWCNGENGWKKSATRGRGSDAVWQMS